MFQHPHTLNHNGKHAIIQGRRDEDDDVYRMRVHVPDRIHSRLCEHLKREESPVGYSISAPLKMLNVTSQEFSECWGFIKNSTTDEELFCLFKDAGFGSSVPVTTRKLDFVRIVLQRYNDAQVFLSLCLIISRLRYLLFSNTKNDLLHWHSSSLLSRSPHAVTNHSRH